MKKMKVEIVYSTHWSEHQSKLTPGVTKTVFERLKQRYKNCTDGNKFTLVVVEGSHDENEAASYFSSLGLNLPSHRGEIGSPGNWMGCVKRRIYEAEDLQRFSFWRYQCGEAYASVQPDFVETFRLKSVGHSLCSTNSIASVSPFGSWPAVEKLMAEEIDSWGLPEIRWRSLGEIRGREIFIMQSSLPPADVLNDCVYANGDLIPYGKEPVTDLKGVIPIEDNFGIPMIRVSAESLTPGDVFRSRQKFSHQRGIRPYPMAVFSTRFKEKIDDLGFDHITWRPVTVEANPQYQ